MHDQHWHPCEANGCGLSPHALVAASWLNKSKLAARAFFLACWPACWGKPSLGFDVGARRCRSCKGLGRVCQAPWSGAGQAPARRT